MSAVYARPATWRGQSTTVHIKFVLPVSVVVEAQTSATWRGSPMLHFQSSWNVWMRSFNIYGMWSVQASKHTHACAQWSHASVGLAQARPKQEVDWLLRWVAVESLTHYRCVHTLWRLCLVVCPTVHTQSKLIDCLLARPKLPMKKAEPHVCCVPGRLQSIVGEFAE